MIALLAAFCFVSGLFCGWVLARNTYWDQVKKINDMRAAIEGHRETITALSNALVKAELRGKTLPKLGVLVPDSPMMRETSRGRKLVRFSQN